MIDIKNALTEKELDDIYKYRQNYATAYSDDEDRGARTGKLVPSEELLKEWARAKQKFYTAFGNKLIVTKKFEYSLSTDVIADNIWKSICRCRNIFNMRNTDTLEAAYRFYQDMSDRIWNGVHETDYNTAFAMRTLLQTSVLASNRIEEENQFVYNGVKAQKGARVTKVIAKLAELFEIEGFESFRLIHSLCLNNKKIKGELCLSIHPLDFMTMSDNNEGWHSCMSWINDGCYRQGTVEMMNSENVIVAYVKADDDYEYCWDVMWNSKKWRQLFIVDGEIITGVKAYPYRNDDITNQALDWIKEIMTDTYSYYDNSVILPEPNIKYNFNLIDGEETNNFHAGFRFSTNNMYNDFGSVTDFPIYIGKNAGNEIINRITYSGRSQCMCCGSFGVEECDSLLCTDCYEVEERIYCDCCGDRLYDGDAYYLDGVAFCYDCYSDKVVYPLNRPGNTETNRSYCAKLYFINENNETFRVLKDYESQYIDCDYQNLTNFISKCGKIGISRDDYYRIYKRSDGKMAHYALEGKEVFILDEEAIKEEYNLEASDYCFEADEIVWLTKENLY